MLDAEQSYLLENSPAMTRRQLFVAALLAVIMPKPIAAMPITCIGMKPTVADLATSSGRYTRKLTLADASHR